MFKQFDSFINIIYLIKKSDTAGMGEEEKIVQEMGKVGSKKHHIGLWARLSQFRGER